jgi:acyl carrier protein
VAVSSRTPEGDPFRCHLCGAASAVEPSHPAGDAVCPRCGQLLWAVRDRLAGAAGVDPRALTLDADLAEVGADSLDVVEAVMELEEEFGVVFPPAELDRVRTLGELIDLIRRLRDAGPTD